MEPDDTGPWRLPSGAVIPQEHLAVNGFRPVAFHNGHFFEQMVYQCFSPFSLPLVYVMRGHVAALNMRFVLNSENGAAVFFQLYLSASLFIAIGCLVALTLRLAVSSTPLSATATDLYWCIVFEAIFVAISAVFQRVAIAIKYAMMSQRDYEAVMTTEQTYHALTADQLIVGWTDLTPDTIDSELSLAGDSLGIDPSVVSLRMPATLARRLQEELSRLDSQQQQPSQSNPDPRLQVGQDCGGAHHEVLDVVHRVNREENDVAASDSPLERRPASALFRHHPEPQASENAAPLRPSAEGVLVLRDGSDEALVSTKWLAAALIADANRRVVARLNSSFGWVSFVLALVGAFLPLCVRVAYGLPAMGDSPLATAVLVNTLHSSLWYVFITLLYLKVGIIDYWRRANAMALLGRLSSRTLAAKVGNAEAAAGGTNALGGLHGIAQLSHASSFRLHPSRATPFHDSRVGGQRAATAPTTVPLKLLPHAPSFHLRSRTTVAPMRRPHSPGPPDSAASSVADDSPLSTTAAGAMAPAPPATYVYVGDDDASGSLAAAPHVIVPPLIPLDRPGNVVAWLAVRRLLHGFGRRFQGRLQLYAGQALLLGGSVAAGIIVKLAVSGDTVAAADSTSAAASVATVAGARLRAATVSLVVIALYSVVVLLAYILAMLTAGATTNGEFAVHRALLTARALEARQAEAHWASRSSEAAAAAAGTSPLAHHSSRHAIASQLPVIPEGAGQSPPSSPPSHGRSAPHVVDAKGNTAASSQAAHWSRTATAIEAAVAGVACDEELSPVRIVGAAASWALVRALALSGGSAVWAIAQLLQSRL